MCLSPSLPIQLLHGLHVGTFSNFHVGSPSSLSSVIFTVTNAKLLPRNRTPATNIGLIRKGRSCMLRRRKFKQTSSEPGRPDPICCWLLTIMNRYYSSRIVREWFKWLLLLLTLMVLPLRFFHQKIEKSWIPFNSSSYRTISQSDLAIVKHWGRSSAIYHYSFSLQTVFRVALDLPVEWQAGITPWMVKSMAITVDFGSSCCREVASH